MKCCDLSPHFYSISSYKYSPEANGLSSMGAVKTQYVYRCLFFTEGSVTVGIGGESVECKAGDLLYLVPGEDYRFLVTESFAVIDLYFDLDKSLSKCDRSVSSCVFKKDFVPSLCSTAPELSDGAILMHNRVFKNFDGAQVFPELLSSNKDGVYFDLFSKVSISSMLYSLLTDEDKKRSSQAERIISYINVNASEDLSAELLEKKFGYHRNHINRIIKQQTGKTLSECIRRAKISHARSLMNEAKMSQSQVAEELGYYDHSHFYKAFVNETGKTPGEL